MKHSKKSIVAILTILAILLSFSGISVSAETSSETYEILKWSRDTGVTTYDYNHTTSNSRSVRYKPAYCPPTINSNTEAQFETRATSNSQTQVNAHNYIYCAVGQITADFDADQDGFYETTSFGSAYLEAEDIILTAAHCVFDTEIDQWGSNIVYHPAQNGYNDTYSSNYESDVISISISQQYANYTGWNSYQDWAICQLEDNLGDIFGWFGMSGEPSANMNLTLAGYPGTGNGYQFSSPGKVTEVVNNMYFTASNYSIQGYSGGPMYDSNGTAFGIYTTVYSDGSGNNSSGATRFVDWLFDMIVDACDESASRW